MDQTAEIASLTYEQARDQLTEIVDQLQSGTSTLQESLTLWERGEALAQHCDAILAAAAVRIDKVVGLDAETGPTRT